jgi:hypothetical protein
VPYLERPLTKLSNLKNSPEQLYNPSLDPKGSWPWSKSQISSMLCSIRVPSCYKVMMIQELKNAFKQPKLGPRQILGFFSLRLQDCLRQINCNFYSEINLPYNFKIYVIWKCTCRFSLVEHWRWKSSTRLLWFQSQETFW